MSGELTSKKLQFLAAFMEKIEAINEVTESQITARFAANNLLRVWAANAHLAELVCSACWLLIGSGFEVRIMYGGTSDRPRKVFHQFTLFDNDAAPVLQSSIQKPAFDVIESNRILADFMDKVQALNARAERPISIKKMSDDIFQVWVCDAYMAQDVVNLCRNLYGSGIGVRIVYGGTSDRPNLVYDEFIPGFFLKK